jgi:hypothetical protein
MNLGGIILLISIIINILLSILYLVIYKNNSNIYYWILASITILLILITVLYFMKNDKPIILAARLSEAEEYKEKYALSDTGISNDFYQNMFTTSEDRVKANSPVGKCPSHAAHSHTCVWDNRKDAEKYCDEINECKGFYKFGEQFAGLGDAQYYNYALKGTY